MIDLEEEGETTEEDKDGEDNAVLLKQEPNTKMLRINRSIDGWIDGWMDGWIDRWINRHADR